MKNKARVFSIIAALFLLTIVAVLAGGTLAIWDTGCTVTEVYAMAFPKSEAIVASTETIEIKGTSISEQNDVISMIDEKVDRDDMPKVSDISGDIKPSVSGDTTKNIQDFTKDGGIHSLVGKTNESEEAVSGENDASQPEEDAEEDAKKERETLKITAEICNIPKVVRAGDEEDSLTNILSIPSMTANETMENIDPLADYPLPYTHVDRSYFDDALFIGDSRVAGLAMNSGTNATFNAVTSFQVYRYKTFKVVQTPNGKVPIFDAMPYDKYTKIYIKVGLNELGSVTDEPFLDAYTSLINDLRVMQPRAIIYIQAILPVTQVKSQTDRVHCNENITKRNANLKSFAELMKCYYVDVGPYFADETGALKAETTADGIHMYGKYMPQWIDALSEQAVVWPPVQ